jgi:hypothetical protein
MDNVILILIDIIVVIIMNFEDYHSLPQPLKSFHLQEHAAECAARAEKLTVASCKQTTSTTFEG